MHLSTVGVHTFGGHRLDVEHQIFYLFIIAASIQIISQDYSSLDAIIRKQLWHAVPVNVIKIDGVSDEWYKVEIMACFTNDYLQKIGVPQIPHWFSMNRECIRVLWQRKTKLMWSIGQ